MNDWDDLRYFLEVARCGNVTSAAARLGVNHSTVSRRLRAMEARHGVSLFERLPGGYQMTSAALTIYQTAEDIEAKNHQVARYLFGQDDRLQGDINLTMPHDVLEFILMDSLKAFKDRYPGITLNISVAKGLKNLASREADIAVRMTPKPPEYLIGKEITKLVHGIYASDQLSLADEVPVIGWSNEVTPPAWALAHYPQAYIAMRVDDLHSMYAAVRAGLGIARMPCYFPGTLADPRVKQLPIELPASDWGLWVLGHVDLRDTPKFRALKEHLIQELTSKHDLFQGRG